MHAMPESRALGCSPVLTAKVGGSGVDPLMAGLFLILIAGVALPSTMGTMVEFLFFSYFLVLFYKFPPVL